MVGRDDTLKARIKPTADEGVPYTPATAGPAARAGRRRGTVGRTSGASERWWLEWTEAGVSRRLPVDRLLRIGRSSASDVVLADPYASRDHCTLGVVDGSPTVDARSATNHVRIDGREREVAALKDGDSFVVGRTSFRVVQEAGDDTTWVLNAEPMALFLRRSTRELVDHEGTLVAKFSSSECAIFETLASHYPDAAPHDALAKAVWGEMGYDQYLIHRLLQRVRQRLADRADLLENVRGAGYRLRSKVTLA